MAFTRKFLAALGIEDEKVEQIITAHTEVTDALKQERDSYRDKAETVDEVQKELNKTKAKLKEFEDAENGEDSWKAKYEAEKTAKEKAENDLKDYKAGVEAKETLENKKTAYKALLKQNGVSEKRIDTILKVTDFEAISLDKEGKIKDSDKLTETIKSEWADFITTKTEEGANVGNPPANNGGNGTGGLSRAAQLAAKHHESLYGATKAE